MTSVEAQQYLDGVAGKLLKIPKIYEEVDAGTSSIRWIRDKVQNIDWIFAPVDQITPDEFSTFIEDSVSQAAEHRQKLRETLTNRAGMVCPVVVTSGASAETDAFVRQYMPRLKMAKTWGRWLFPIIVDLGAGSAVCPDRLPPRMTTGGLIGRSFAKRARKTTAQSLQPAGVEPS
jgi:hypothetical protein